MKKIGLTLLFSFLTLGAQAQTTVIITDTSKAIFAASADHNTLFAGAPVLTNYTIDIFVKTNPTGTGIPLFTANLGKPTPTGSDVISPALKTLFTLLPNTEYIYFLKSVGPGGTTRSAASSDPFGFPGAPAAIVGKPGIQ